MNLKNNFEFPHPIITNSKNHYKDAVIDFKHTSEVEDTHLKLSYIFKNTSAYIEELIKEKKVCVYLLIDSDYSMYRDIIKVETFNKEINTFIDLQDITEQVILTPFVVATQDIDNFYSEEFTEPESYYIEKHDIIGLIDPVIYSIDNKVSQFENISSIFTIRKTDSKNKAIRFDFTNDFIVVLISDPVLYDQINTINIDGSNNHVLYTLLILQPLYQALFMLENDKFTDLQWNQVIREKVLKHRKTLSFNERQASDMAQQLLNYPITQSVFEIATNTRKDL